MSGEKTENEKLGGVLLNGIGSHESPGVGVSGSRPLVNGDLRDGDSESEYGRGKSAVLTDSASEGGSSSAGKQGDVVVKPASPSVSLIVSSKSNILPPTGKPRSGLPYHSRQQHRLPPLNYYRYVPLATHQPAPVFYPTQHQAYLGGGAVQGGGVGVGGVGAQLSSTNLYIRGLSERCCDDDLTKMCQQFGKIVSTKAILDKQTSFCKGYGFVDFESPLDAMKAVQSLQSSGVMAQFAKQQEQDPTNLYFSNLPKSYDEKSLEALVSPYGNIVSTRILRDQAGASRGVGFVRLDTKDNCDKTIEMLNGSTLQDSPEPLMVKFADSSSNKKRQHGPGRWRDMADYVYDSPHMLAQNGLVSSRVIQPGVVASPYVQTPTHHLSSYQVPVSQAMSTGTWQPTYYVQPSTQTALAASSSVEGVASHLTTHLNQLHISTSSPYTAAHQPTAYATGAPQPTTYQIAPQGAAQYAQHTPGGWTFSHTPLLTQQDHVSEVHTGGSEGKGHIQVIATDHTPSLGQDDPQQQHPVHLYYTNSNWAAK